MGLSPQGAHMWSCLCHTGVSIILGVLFYLMQARKFLQEGMTYILGRSFYLAWINVFFFFMIGLTGLGVASVVRMMGMVRSGAQVAHRARKGGSQGWAFL